MTFDRLLTRDHRECDELLAEVLDLAQSRNLVGAAEVFKRFHARIAAHFEAEEALLFPRFEQLTGMTHGPTEVMRMEHADVRDSLQRIDDAIAEGDANAVFGESDALLMQLQQHNLKEENVLYPAAVRAMAAGAAAVSEEIRFALASGAVAAD